MPQLIVNKKEIGKLFSEMQNKKFLIPDYQRPYNWDVEKCAMLWNDIVEFNQGDNRVNTDYFLGTIVYFCNENKDFEIIDGQQRITSLMLMLRAFYTKLEGMPTNDNVLGLKRQIEPCLWDTDEISQLVNDKSKIHIISEVITEDDNKVLSAIITTGNSAVGAKDNYSQNYQFFSDRCDDYAKNYPIVWEALCVCILKKCIILPIECSTQDTALTIFSTLNDRGMPLADSDIFKAQIYRSYKSPEKRNEFTENWKELFQICSQSNFTIDDIFRYYMHIIRAKDGDKSKEVGLRKFYSGNNFKLLKDEDLINELLTLAKFWQYLILGKETDEINNSKISMQAKKYLHCLKYYPNEYWKYPVSVFYLTNLKNENFEKAFEDILNKLMVYLFAKFIIDSSVNAIRDDIYQFNILIKKNKDLEFRTKHTREDLSREIPKQSSSRLSRSLLLLHAYLNPEQKDLIVDTFDIEHIFPQKWQDTSYNGWNFDDAKKYLENFGNKSPLEKKLNIQAGNDYFNKKKDRYKESKIAEIIELSNSENKDWTKDNIEKREKSFINRILDYFNQNGVIDNSK